MCVCVCVCVCTHTLALSRINRRPMAAIARHPQPVSFSKDSNIVNLYTNFHVELTFENLPSAIARHQHASRPNTTSTKLVSVASSEPSLPQILVKQQLLEEEEGEGE
jgi:hypothetical protein